MRCALPALESRESSFETRIDDTTCSSPLKGCGPGYEQANAFEGAACQASIGATNSQDDVFILEFIGDQSVGFE